MAPRANWKGYLRLSLVSCPVALYPASSLSEKVSFNRLNRKTGNRLKQQNVDSETGELVPATELLKRIGDVPGLARIMSRLGMEGGESFGHAAAAMANRAETPERASTAGDSRTPRVNRAITSTRCSGSSAPVQTLASCLIRMSSSARDSG